MSVTMRDGLVARDGLDRRTETNLSDAEHLLVEPGDLAYNTMRMWQGAFGIAERRGNVSPAYVVMRPTKAMEPRFAWHWLKSNQALYQLWSYSYGLTDDRLRLYAADFRMVPMAPPPLPVQRRIAAVLDAWDEAIALSERLLAAKRRRRKGVATRLISDRTDRRQELGNFASLRKTKTAIEDLPTDARVIELEDVESLSCRLLRTRNPEGLSGSRAVYRADDVLFGKLRPYLRKFVQPDHDGAASTEMWVLVADPRLCTPRYLFYAVQSRPFAAEANRPTGSRMPRADWDCVSEAPIHLPPLEDQRRITTSLDALTDEIDLLAARTDLLRIQKRGLMQRLLTGEVRVPESLDALMPAVPPREAAE